MNDPCAEWTLLDEPSSYQVPTVQRMLILAYAAVKSIADAWLDPAGPTHSLVALAKLTQLI